MAASGMKVASVRRRLAAASIDTVGMLVITVGPFALMVARHERRNGVEPFSIPWLDWLQKSRALNKALSLAGTVAMRNRRSPGRRIAGIRAADAATGGPVSVRASTIRHITGTALSEFVSSLTRPMQVRNMERLKALGPETMETARMNRTDPAARRALLEQSRLAQNSCLGCLIPLLFVSGVNYLPALRSPLNQTLPERLAGIVIVAD
jgi:hypothetical protein